MVSPAPHRGCEHHLLKRRYQYTHKSSDETSALNESMCVTTLKTRVIRIFSTVEQLSTVTVVDIQFNAQKRAQPVVGYEVHYLCLWCTYALRSIKVQAIKFMA